MNLEENALVTVDKSLLYPPCQSHDQCSRVRNYESKMLIQPHTNLVEV